MGPLLRDKLGRRLWRIWVPGVPRSRASKKKTNPHYVDSIRQAAKARFRAPLSGSIEVEVVFVAKSNDRPDADNVLKPILDALQGIAYQDDKQVVSPRSTVLEQDDSLRVDQYGRPHLTFCRVLDEEVFLIEIRQISRPSLVDEMRSS